MSDEKDVSTSSVEEAVVTDQEATAETTEGQTQEPGTESLANDEVRGLKEGIQAERAKRQAAEERAALVEQMYYQNLEQGGTKEPDDDYDPEDIPTNETVKKMIQKEMGSQSQQQRETALVQMEANAKQKHEDYEKVVGIGSYFDQLQRDQPGLLDAIQNSPNPYELAYKIGQTHPAYQEQLIKKVTEEAAEKIQKNLNKTSTLSDVGGELDDESKKFQSMSDKEFEKEIHRVKGY